MVKRVSVDLIDDLDGSVLETDAGRTFTFEVDHVRYEIDLSTTNIDRFHTAIADYVAAARVIPQSRPTSTKPTRRRKSTTELVAVRNWAREHGFEVSSHGRVPEDVRAAYDAAHA